jgi:hypothetical protein
MHGSRGVLLAGRVRAIVLVHQIMTLDTAVVPLTLFFGTLLFIKYLLHTLFTKYKLISTEIVSDYKNTTPHLNFRDKKNQYCTGCVHQKHATLAAGEVRFPLPLVDLHRGRFHFA